MIIGLDGKRAVANMTGLGNYSRLVAEQLAACYPEDSFYLYIPTYTRRQQENPRLKPLLQHPNLQFRFPYGIGPLSHGALWRSIGITRHFQADHLDLFHGLSNELPLNVSSAGIPSVVTIHDVIYRRMPDCYPPLDRKIYDWKYGSSVKVATRIIAISECTKRDIIEIYGADPDRIDVIYQGCDQQFALRWEKDRIDKLKKKYKLPEHYIIQVGTIERRKNLDLTVKALSVLPKYMGLVVVGRDNGWLSTVKGLARELGVADRITFLEGIPFAELPGLYQGSDAVVYPSRYEGFGIPVLEGLQSHRPVVAATGSCLEEAGGEGAWYVNPDDARSMGEILNRIIARDTEVDSRIEAGLRHAARFDNSFMASSIMNTYCQAIENYRQ